MPALITNQILLEEAIAIHGEQTVEQVLKIQSGASGDPTRHSPMVCWEAH
jgi:hypothetical protein